VRKGILDALDELAGIPIDELVAARTEKYRRISDLPGRFPRVP
jgi:acetyl-CoA carboxylase alpha subunit